MKSFKRVISVILTMAFILQLFSVLGLPVLADTEEVSQGSDYSDSITSNDYFSYYNKYCDTTRYNGELVLGSDNVSATGSGSFIFSNAETPNMLMLGETNNWIEWNITVPQTAMYAITISYYPIQSDAGNDITFSMLLDGSLPYNEAKVFAVKRVWCDGSGSDGTTIYQGKNGDDIRPQQVQAPQIVSAMLINAEGLYEEPYMFYFEAGQHKLRMEYGDGEIAVSKLSLGSGSDTVSYSSYITAYSQEDYIDGKTVYQEAEQAYLKNSSVLYPTYDNSTCDVTPNSTKNIRLNTIGQENWSANGDMISWKAPVTKAGLYKISFHANQDFKASLDSYRTLTINGKIPFEEARYISFSYKSGWYLKVLGDTSPLLVYLKPGDVIGLISTTGKMSGVLRNIRGVMLNLNELYRNIVTITGSNPDKYQDYYLESRIKSLPDLLNENIAELQQTEKAINQILGFEGGQGSVIKRVYQVLQSLAKDTYYIPAKLSSFKSSIEDLGSLLSTMKEQPLELDYIAFTPANANVTEVKQSFIKTALFEINRFLYTFFSDYSSVADAWSNGKKSIKVWAATGRDQAQILSNMINDSFVEKYGIPVELSLVSSSANLKEAAIVGKGPDVALMIDQITPVNLAMRGALADLSGYDFSTLKSQTGSSSWTPFYFNGGLYAVPETEIFNVMFYRTDIFEELGLKVPDTWDDFYSVMETLQRNSLDVGVQEVDAGNAGVSAGIATFNMFLFQNGGTYYNDKLTATRFNEEVSYQAFLEWVNLYKKYSLDRDFNFFNRFRSGEMPLGISSYASYCQFVAAAPEINGLWSFAPIPGTKQQNGSVNRSQSTTVTGSIVLTAANTRGVLDESVSFVKWWTGSDTQTRYGKELEASLGIKARYTPANQISLQSLGWAKTELTILNESLRQTKNVQEIPGNYMISRSLTNAMRSVLTGNYTARRALTVYNFDMNSEIKRKRAEFHLDNGG